MIAEEERLIHIKNSLDSQMEHINRNYKKFGKDELFIKIDNTSNELCLNVNMDNYPLRDFVGIYSELSNTLKSYNKLNHRNSKKSEEALYKHAMHLIRLFIMGTDILNGKGIITKRIDEHNLLMDIRNGKYTFDEIFEITNDIEKQFIEAKKNTKLPEEANMKEIEIFLIKAYTGKIK